MSEEIVRALLLLVGTLAGVWGTVQVARRSERAQQRKETQDAQAAEQARNAEREASLWERMETRMREQDEKIKDLSDRLTATTEQAERQATQIRELQDRERDREELLADYRTHTLAWMQYVEKGMLPPPPDHTWRIQADLDQMKKEAS